MNSFGIIRFLTIIILALSIQAVKSQEANPLASQSTIKDIFVVVRDYPHGAVKLQLLNPVTGEQRDYLDLRQAKYQIPQVSLSNDHKYIFGLEVEEGSSVWPPFNSSRIVRYDMTSDERLVVFSRKNILHFALSPDDSEILVYYYPDEITALSNITVGLGLWCVLSVETNNPNCESIPRTEKFVSNEMFWVSNKKLAYISEKGDAVKLVDKVSFATDSVSLPQGVYADHLLPIKDSEDILIHVSPVDATGDCKLLTLNTATNELHLITDLTCSSAVTFLSVDVHTQTLIIGYASNPALIIDLSRGEVLKELPSLLGMEWNNVQWLDEGFEAFVIGQLYYKGKPIAIAIFQPIMDSTLNILPITQDEIILAIP